MTDVRDHLYNDWCDFARNPWKQAQQNAVKRMLVRIWRLLPYRERQKFMACVEGEPDLEFRQPVRVFEAINDPELEQAALWWSKIMRDLPGDDEAIQGMAMNFARCVRTGKSPSGKIIAFAKRYFRDWKATQSVEEYGVFESE